MKSKSIKRNADELLMEWTGEKIKWFKPEALADTRKMLEKYYSGKMRDPLLKYEVESALKQLEKYPAFPVLRLTYKESWHPEHIAAELRCTEKLIPQLVDKMVKRVALMIWGVDSLIIE
jgi:hypothetical protein